jgi:hypothetical protein
MGKVLATITQKTWLPHLWPWSEAPTAVDDATEEWWFG